MKIVCLNNKWFTYHFTVGKVYDVTEVDISSGNPIYKIKDDVGIPKFITLESYRNEKIEDILK